MTSVVYFLQSDDGAVKIGRTTNLKQRVVNLSVGNSLQIKVLASLPGDRALEEHLHERFSSDRISGEWFRPSSDLLALIDRVKHYGAAVFPAGLRPAEPSVGRDASEARALRMASRLVKDLSEEIDGPNPIKCNAVARRAGLTSSRTYSILRADAKVTLHADELLGLRAALVKHGSKAALQRELRRVLGEAEQIVAALDRLASGAGR